MIYLHSIDPAANRFRWYSLELQPCLFGGIDLVRHWGRLGQTGGTRRVDHVSNEETAAARIAQPLRLRDRHDYVRVA